MLGKGHGTLASAQTTARAPRWPCYPASVPAKISPAGEISSLYLLPGLIELAKHQLKHGTKTLPPCHDNRRRVPRPGIFATACLLPSPGSRTPIHFPVHRVDTVPLRTAPACQRSSPWPDILPSPRRLPSSPRFTSDMLARQRHVKSHRQRQLTLSACQPGPSMLCARGCCCTAEAAGQKSPLPEIFLLATATPRVSCSSRRLLLALSQQNGRCQLMPQGPRFSSPRHQDTSARACTRMPSLLWLPENIGRLPTTLLAPIKGRRGHRGWTPPSSSDT
jgi:hypothetical protein